MRGTNSDATSGFYDELAGDYYLFTNDWWTDVESEAAFYAPILRDQDVSYVIDASCGPGTQAIGLRSLGFSVSAFDISPVMLAEARQNAERRGVEIDLRIGDILELSKLGESADAVISAGNAFAHFSSLDEVVMGTRALLSVLRPGGRAYIGIRDYDELLRRRPSFDFRRVRINAGITTLMYDYWEYGDNLIKLNLFILHLKSGGWNLDRYLQSYLLPITRKMLSHAAALAGGKVLDFLDHRWGIVAVLAVL